MNAQKLINMIVNAMAIIAAVLMALIMIAIAYATISRYFFGNPMAWVVEVSSYSLLYITFLAAPWLLRQDAHVKVDLVLNKLKPKSQSALNLFNNAIGVAIAVILLVFGFKMTLNNYREGIVVMNILRTPQYMLLVIIPVGTFFLAIEFLKKMLYEIRTIRDK